MAYSSFVFGTILGLFFVTKGTMTIIDECEV